MECKTYYFDPFLKNYIPLVTILIITEIGNYIMILEKSSLEVSYQRLNAI